MYLIDIIIYMIESIFEFFSKKKINDKCLKRIARRYKVDIKRWSYKNHKLTLWVDWVDKQQTGISDNMIQKIQAWGIVSNIVAIAPNGDYIRRALVTKNNTTWANLFESGGNDKDVKPIKR